MLKWLYAVEENSAKYEDFEKPGKRFATLDRKLGIALQATLSGEVLRRVKHLRQLAADDEGKLMAGRQVLYEIYKDRSTSHTSQKLFSAEGNHRGSSGLGRQHAALQDRVGG